MAPERIPAIFERLDHLTETVNRLEELIMREIKELKSEQIAELKRQNERLADDQRRAWEAIRAIENRENRMAGRDRAVQAMIGVIGLFLGSAATAFVAKYFK